MSVVNFGIAKPFTSLKEVNENLKRCIEEKSFEPMRIFARVCDKDFSVSMKLFLSLFWIPLQNFPDAGDKDQIAHMRLCMTQIFPVKDNREEYRAIQELFKLTQKRKSPNEEGMMELVQTLRTFPDPLRTAHASKYVLNLPKKTAEQVQLLKKTLSYLLMEQYLVSHFFSIAQAGSLMIELRQKLTLYMTQRGSLPLDLGLFSLLHVKHIEKSEEFALYLSYKKLMRSSGSILSKIGEHLAREGTFSNKETPRSFFRALTQLYGPSSSELGKELKEICLSNVEYFLSIAFFASRINQLPPPGSLNFYLDEISSDPAHLFFSSSFIGSLLFKTMCVMLRNFESDPLLSETSSDADNAVFFENVKALCRAYPHFYPQQASRYEEAFKVLKDQTLGKKDGHLDFINKNPFSEGKDLEFPPTLQALKEEAPFSVKDILKELVLGKAPLLARQESASAHSKSTNASSSSSPAPSLEEPLQCEPREFPFAYDVRVSRWFNSSAKQMDSSSFAEYVDCDDTYKELMLQLHGFSQKADLFYHIGMKRPHFEKEGQTLFIIPAELSCDGVVLRGTVTYCIDEENVCYHRFFTKCEKHGEVIEKIVENTFSLSDFPELSKETQARKVQVTSKRADKVSSEDDFSIDPIFDFVTIHDKRLHVTLKLFPVNE